MNNSDTFVSYGLETVRSVYFSTRRLIVISVTFTLTIVVILFYYYIKTGDKAFLVGGVIVLAMLPVDVGILYSLLKSAKNRLPQVIQSLIDYLEPVSVGAIRVLGSTALSMKLRDGSILYVTVSTNNVKGIYIANLSVTSVEPGLDKVKPPWRQAGLWTVLSNDFRTGFSLQCKSSIVGLGKGKAYTVPDPEHPRAISVVGKAWYIAASCPTHLTPERLVHLLVEGLNAINRGEN